MSEPALGFTTYVDSNGVEWETRDAGDHFVTQPTGRCMCRKCGEPLRSTEVWFRVQRGVAPERIGLCTRCAMAKIPGRVSL